MARLLAGYIPTFIDDLALWVKEVETKLRTKGLNGNIFKTVLNSGSDYLKSCQELLEAAKGICRRMETITDSTGAEQLGKVIADNSIRLKELEPKILRWKKIADRQSPELTPEVLEGAERGAEQIRQGKFKTGEQLLEEIRSRKPSN
jgi:hypothetical protein